MKYEKIVKWILAVLFLLGVAVTVYALANSKNTDGPSIDVLLYSTYAFAGIAIAAVAFGVIVIGGINNPKGLLTLGIGLVAIAVIVVVAYVLAPGTPAVGYIGDPVSDGKLKLTDTTLNLTYFAVGASFIALIASWIIGATRK